MLTISGQMKVSEQQLTRAKLPTLVRLRFFHLNNQVTLGKNRGRRVSNGRSGGDIILVRETCALTGVCLNHDLMTMVDQLNNTCGRQTHTVLVVFDFLWNANTHNG